MSSFTTKTLDDAVAEIREIINDSNVAFGRFTNAQVLQKLNTALRETYRYRPDAWIGNFVQGVFSNKSPLPTYDITDLGLLPPTPWPIDDRLFFSPVVFYVAGMLDITDDEFSDDGRAVTLLTAFRNQLIGPGG